MSPTDTETTRMQGNTAGQDAAMLGRSPRKSGDTVALFGMPITNVTMTEAVARIEEYIGSGKTHQIATANLDFARNSLRDPYLQGIICECSMVLPDGAPMLWASRMFRAGLRERVTGVDLIPELARLSQEKGYGIFLLGSTEESSEAAAQVLTRRFPKVRIVGRHCPPIAPLHEMDDEDFLWRIEQSEARIVFVGFGNPKQEIWIHRHRDRLPPAVYIGIGGSLDLIAGKLKRAPMWVRKLQLEWLYRMAQEPLRLMPRYLRDSVALLSHLPLGVAANRMQPFERRQRGTAVHVRTGFRVFATPGKLGARAAALLVEEAKSAAGFGETLVIDMTATLRVEAEGIGGLLEARRTMLEQGNWIWLVSMSNPVRRFLQFSAVVDLFRMAPTPAAAIQATRVSQSGQSVDYEYPPGDDSQTNQADGEPTNAAARAS